MLQSIQHISYEKEQTGIRMRVFTDKGDVYEAFIPSFRSYENEQGVILPFTVMCALFISALFLHAVALYHTDIQFLKKRKVV